MGRYRNLFVVTYGRSGSTLLQGLLNTIPGYLIRGENMDLLGHAQRLFESLTRSPDWESALPHSTAATNAWFGCEFLKDSAYRRAIALMVENLLLGDRQRADISCLGFKEIRYPVSQLQSRLGFMQALFPQAGFIFNTRAAAEVLASQAAVGFSERQSAHDIAQLDAAFESLARSRENCCLLRYEDVVEMRGSFREMFAFLDEPFNAPVLRAQLQERHSYHRGIAGAIYSEFPAHVKLNRAVPNIDFFTIDKLTRTGPTCSVGGVLVPSPGTSARIDQVVISGRYKADGARIETGLPSPSIARQLQRDDAATSRFSITFDLPGPTFCHLRLDTGDVIATLEKLHELH